MDRINTPSRAMSKHGAGRDGFTAGDPATGVPATELSPEWFDGVQETLMHTIETAGLTPQSGDHGQLTEAIRRHTGVPLVRQPKNVTPAAGATGLGETPTLTASAYYSLYGVSQGAARFEVSQSEGFEALVHAATVAGSATSHTVPGGVLATASVYWWRVSYQDAEGNWSLSSAATGFTTGGVFEYVARPAVETPANNATGVSTTPTFTFSAFQAVGGADTHAATQVQVATDEGFASVIHDSGAGQPGAAYTVPAGGAFAPLLILHVRVRHQGARIGWSVWSPAVRFQCAARPAAPVITAPASGADGVLLPVIVQATAFQISGGVDAHAMSRWQIATDAAGAAVAYDSGETADLVSHTVPLAAGLATATGYFARCQHKGLATGWGPWSAASGFTTALPSGSVTFAAAGTHDWPVPAGVFEVERHVRGAGGAGGSNAGGGGGGGGFAADRVAVVPGQILSIVVGAAGTGVAGLAGNSGGTSSIGAGLAATGGQGGRGGGSAGDGTGGAGGIGVGGAIIRTGGHGGDGATQAGAGGGGAAGLAAGGGSGTSTTGGDGGDDTAGDGGAPLVAGGSPGGGGGGSPISASPGASGGAGRVDILWGSMMTGAV